MNVKISDLYDLEHTIAADYLRQFEYPWEALAGIKNFILELGPTLPKEEFEEVSEHVWIARDAKVIPSAYLGAPLIVDHEAEIRQCAFIRGSAIVGKNAVVGNSTELKNSILMDHVQCPHFNYVGDSILGYYSHTGAGVITSNLKSDHSLVVVKDGEEKIETKIKKFGAMLGDHVEVGCNSVLNPGTVVCCNTNIYPLSNVRGVVPANSIFKAAGNVVTKR
jgi:UDP-N-acetylglucosamine diphosphorylase / glucose-1-phosphate thymidylyltransferase / UDP-N-acetylgalactosamine diphosphorylase / glucosamine-1-phosphate N-acetyltransferase / galactosamine-1-phosphate N-acetyltransferase